MSDTSLQGAVRDNRDLRRFELVAEGGVVFADYRATPEALIITHTETPWALRGRGLASQLIQGALEQIRQRGLKVVPACSFVADYIDMHPEFASLRK